MKKFIRLTLFLVVVIHLVVVPCVLAQQEEPAANISDVYSKELWRKFEIEVHYSQWSIDLVKNLFEKDLINSIGKEIRKELSSQVRESHPYLVKDDYEYGLLFDSGGYNYGLEIRYYPNGKESPFSLGFSLEKTHIRLSVDGPVKQKFTNGTYAEIKTEGYVKLNSVTTNINFRWDMNPEWIVTPYFVFGLGIGTLNGEVGYYYNGYYNWGGPKEELSESDIRTLKETEEEIDFNIPNIFLLLQTNLGLRVRIMKFLHLRAEAGFWDGFLCRAGLAFSF
ncbi:MAG: hypothetical protein IBX60_03950 [Candidatus Aminicenantes bacterium]|nr:hypothetical protein [Candidatus Aminicenantes bacterium]